MDLIGWVYLVRSCVCRCCYSQIVVVFLLDAPLGVCQFGPVLHLLLLSAAHSWGFFRGMCCVVSFVRCQQYLDRFAYAFHCCCRVPGVFLQRGFVICFVIVIPPWGYPSLCFVVSYSYDRSC